MIFFFPLNDHFSITASFNNFFGTEKIRLNKKKKKRLFFICQRIDRVECACGRWNETTSEQTRNNFFFQEQTRQKSKWLMLNLLLISVCLSHSTAGCVGTFNHTLQLIQIIELAYGNSLVDEMDLHARIRILINFHCTWHTKRNLLLAIVLIFLLLKSNFNKFFYLFM